MKTQRIFSSFSASKTIAFQTVGKSVLLVLCVFFIIDVFGQNSHYSVTAEPDPTFSDLKSLHLNKTPIDKNQYEESTAVVSNERSKAISLPYSFMVFQSEKESSAEMYRMNGGLLYMNRSEFRSMGLTLVKGDHTSVFQNEFDLLISENLATKIFGSEDPINKIMIMDDRYAILIKGVFRGSSLPFMKELDFIAGKRTHHKINSLQ